MDKLCIKCGILYLLTQKTYSGVHIGHTFLSIRNFLTVNKLKDYA